MTHKSYDIFDASLWTDDISEARKIQEHLKKEIKLSSFKKSISCIAGVDAAFFADKVIAVATFYTYPGLLHIKDLYSVEKVSFPYIPGFLSFREGFAIMKALCKSDIQPDVILFDGHGIAHPKGIGVASHMGVILKTPSIGCAKSRLVGDYEEPDAEKGSWEPLFYKGDRVGVVLRTRTNVKPVFVSPGHLIDIDISVKIILGCTLKYRMPEPLRRADKLSKALKKSL